MTENFLDDQEFGKLCKRDAYLYEGGGKYKHCYQVYSPLREGITMDETVRVTASMQARNNQRKKQSSREL